MSSRPVNPRLEEYWDWFAVALFVLITVDMITTMYAMWYIGPAAEANPFLRHWAFGRGIATLAGMNILATVIAVGGFYVLMRQVRTTSPPYDRYVGIGVEAWLGGLIAAGLYVFANNLAVIVHGQSLLLGG